MKLRPQPGAPWRARFAGFFVLAALWNDATALATARWYPTRIVPASLPAETARQLGPAKTPLIVAQVLVKQEDGWKIAFTSFVPPED